MLMFHVMFFQVTLKVTKNIANFLKQIGETIRKVITQNTFDITDEDSITKQRGLEGISNLLSQSSFEKGTIFYGV